jgi:predicted nucleic acid-binding protein
MPLVYLDTSAFLRRFKSEPGSAGIRALFQTAEADSRRSIVLVTSGWTLNESAGVLRREHHKGRITKKEMEEAFAEIIAEAGLD